jgi:LmbE family N-acetylglucosaminyl deacetylase
MDDDDIRQVTQLGTIVGVWAHPDDEAYLSGGLMAMAVDAGSRVVCVTATRGEHGSPDPVRWPPDRLARTRERELAASLAALGVTEHRWLAFEDGTCAAVDPDTVAPDLAKIITAVGADTVLTFGPDGMTGHLDHRAVSHWVSAACAVAGRDVRLLHATTSPRYASRFAELHERFNVFEPGTPVTTDEADLALHLRLDRDLLDRKVVALRAQASQTTGLIQEIGEDEFADWVAEECFSAPAPSSTAM